MRARLYAYVICELTDGLPSFRHELLWANSERDAYMRAHKIVRQPNGNGLNDYVFEVFREDEK